MRASAVAGTTRRAWLAMRVEGDALLVDAARQRRFAAIIDPALDFRRLTRSTSVCFVVLAPVGSSIDAYAVRFAICQNHSGIHLPGAILVDGLR